MPAHAPRRAARGRHAAPRRVHVLPGIALVASVGLFATVSGAPVPLPARATAVGARPAPDDGRGPRPPRTPEPAAAPPVRELERASRSAPRGPAYVLPVVGPVTSPFGRRWGRLHAGLDLGVPSGTQVRAVSDAVVLSVEYQPRGYGHYVTLQHADGTLSLYAHLSVVLVTGGAVAAGQVIALSGSSGHSTGPHLHFELRSPDGPFDPAPWLRERGIAV